MLAKAASLYQQGRSLATIGERFGWTRRPSPPASDRAATNCDPAEAGPDRLGSVSKKSSTPIRRHSTALDLRQDYGLTLTEYPMTSRTSPITYSADRWFRDGHGKLVVFQRPNPPLVVWIAARIIETVLHVGSPKRLVEAVAFGALFTWGWLELFSGSAYIRRVLGMVVLVALVVGRARG